MQIFKLVLLVQVQGGKLVFCTNEENTFWIIPNWKIAGLLILLQCLMYAGFALAFFVGKMLRENATAVAIMLADAGVFYSFFWGVNKWAANRHWIKLVKNVSTSNNGANPK